MASIMAKTGYLMLALALTEELYILFIDVFYFVNAQSHFNEKGI